MATPTSRAMLKEYCLRKLGKPVIDINVDDDQVDDRIDEALQFFQEYHFDGVEKVYEKQQITPSTLKFTGGPGVTDAGTQIYGVTSGANASIIRVSSDNTNWLDVTWEREHSANGVAKASFQSGEAVRVGETNASVGTLVTDASDSESYFDKGVIGNQFVDIPESIIGITKVFKPSTSSLGMWDVRYQMRMNDVTQFGAYMGTSELLSYEMRMKHVSLIEELLTGQVPIRFNRHADRMYVDWDWSQDAVRDEYLIIEGYKIVDPSTFTDVYNDMFLKRYATALIREQWGINLSKFEGVQMPGGVTLNGRAILEDARAELEQLREQMQVTYELPAEMMMA
tara:strand:- start:3504 stop:4520 length:1017 start_codon:yes stop_codon:yes gene_type:complete